MAAKKGVSVLEKLFDLIEGANKDLSTQYPEIGPPDIKINEKGNPFGSKKQTQIEAQLMNARTSINKDIAAGNYDPIFPIEQRYYADDKGIDIQGNTLIDTLPKTQKTLDAKRAQFDTPDAHRVISEAIQRSMGDPNKMDWYAMGQLQDAFIEEHGPELGRKLYDEMFAQAMASTTAGNSPDVNLIAAGYGNFMRNQGQRLPETPFELPSPVGGRRISMNTKKFNKVFNDNVPLTSANDPKMFNFRANFLGQADRATMDEQMTKGMTKGKESAPPPGTYGILENIVGEEAAKVGLKAMNAQDIVWADLKGIKGKPMISFVNEAIERTARLTNRTPQEVLKGFTRGMPLYGMAGMGILDQAQMLSQFNQELQEVGAN